MALNYITLVLDLTPMYMAPEQLEGFHLDPRSDLFALGIVMYYRLAGRNPWEHIDNVAKIMYSVVNSQVDVSGLPVSTEFRQVLARLLALRPDDRFPEATSVQQALKAIPEWQSGDALRRFSGDDFSESVILTPGPRPTPLPAKALRIGRVPDNDVVLSDLNVSRHHAELRKPTPVPDVTGLSAGQAAAARAQWVTREKLRAAGVGLDSLAPMGQQPVITPGVLSADAQTDGSAQAASSSLADLWRSTVDKTAYVRGLEEAEPDEARRQQPQLPRQPLSSWHCV